MKKMVIVVKEKSLVSGMFIENKLPGNSYFCM